MNGCASGHGIGAVLGRAGLHRSAWPGAGAFRAGGRPSAFDYGQRHRVELDCAPRIRERMPDCGREWNKRLGDDHVITLDALAAISETALTRDMAIEVDGQPPADRRSYPGGT